MKSTCSSKLAALLRLCFTAGIVFSTSSAFADCTTDTLCTQPGPVHDAPGFCDIFPDNIACFDHGQTSSGPEPYDIAPYWIPHNPANTLQVGCASSLDQRRASAASDIMAWWVGQALTEAWWTFAPPEYPGFTVGPGYITVAYVSGEAQIWNISTIDPTPAQAGYGTSSYIGTGALGNVFISPVTPFVSAATGQNIEWCYNPFNPPSV